MSKIKVLIVDDHEIVRLGLHQLLENYPDLEIVETACSAAEVVVKTEQSRPNVILMDIRLKGSSGIDACREIVKKYPEISVIMLTSYGDEQLVMESIFAGASGYILKDVGNEEIIRAIRAVFHGESLLDPVITTKLLQQMRRNGQKFYDGLEQLTDQEKKVLLLIAEGKTNRHIADEVFLSEKTVRNYVSNILSKLNLTNRTEAAAYAAQHNMIHRA